MEQTVNFPSVESLVKAGVHFGHQSSRWHPRMKPYIYGEKNQVHIIHVQKTLEGLKKANELIQACAAQGQGVLLCATKKQSQELVKEECDKAGLFYVQHRWLGGMLTNFATVQSSIAQLKKIEKFTADGTYEKFTKKEVASFERKREKLTTYFGGIRDMTALPGALIVIDADRESIAVKEANRLAIPIIGVVDTNTNPDPIHCVIPGNDDSLKSIELYLKFFGESFQAGKAKRKSESDEKTEGESLEGVKSLQNEDDIF